MVIPCDVPLTKSDAQRRQLTATVAWAQKLRAVLQPLLDAHGDRVHFRPSAGGISMVGLLPERPQRGKSSLRKLDAVVTNFEVLFLAHCQNIEHGRITGEKALQSYLIRNSHG